MQVDVDKEWQLYVGGGFVPRGDRDALTVRNPATGERIAEATAGTASDVERAVSAARDAFPNVRERKPGERAELLHAIADAIEEHKEELAYLETYENGKPLAQAKSDAESAVERVRYYAGGADKFLGEVAMSNQEEVGKKVYEPYGVVGVIIPWNWPLVNSIDFAATAIATGNAVVVKPAPETPLSALRMAELVDDILPDGAYNVVTGGDEPGKALTSHADVDKLAFVGNDKTGEAILESTAKTVTPSMMELGGKNAAIVFPDADLDRALSGVVYSSFKNNGEACSGSERLLVHKDIYEDFVDRLKDRVRDVHVADGLDEGAQVGPLVSREQRDRVDAAVQEAESEGATIAAQADVPSDPEYADGYWFPPTLIENVEPGMSIEQEEVFGPVLAVMPFSDEEEALEIANGTEYGLSGYVWTSNLQRAQRFSDALEVGKVSVNSPSGGKLGLPHGGFKRTGFGRKNDFTETMREFVQSKSVYMDLTDSDLSL